MTDEPTYLVCMPIFRMLNPVKDSFVTPCTKCLEPLWVSTSSQKVLHRATIVCPECANTAAHTAAQQGDPLKFGGFIPGQLDELRDNLD